MPRKLRSATKIKRRAGLLRKEPSPAEAKLWRHLRGNRLAGVSFRRQHSIGPYVVDFCSPAKKVIVELDGSQHLQDEEKDARRTEYLRSEGYRVLRFWNDAVMSDVDGVLLVIQRALKG
jgi:very-short-patch-repair endonuclease